MFEVIVNIGLGHVETIEVCNVNSFIIDNGFVSFVNVDNDTVAVYDMDFVIGFRKVDVREHENLQPKSMTKDEELEETLIRR